MSQNGFFRKKSLHDNSQRFVFKKPIKKITFGSFFIGATDVTFYHFVIINIVRKLIFWNFIFQPLVLEFFLVSYDTHIGWFPVIWKSRILKNFSKIKKKFGLSFFSFQLNAKNCFVISHMVRLWWKMKSVAPIKETTLGSSCQIVISTIRI
jgi:hypothetical protein